MGEALANALGNVAFFAVLIGAAAAWVHRPSLPPATNYRIYRAWRIRGGGTASVERRAVA
jgi:hypothetical protein